MSTTNIAELKQGTAVAKKDADPVVAALAKVQNALKAVVVGLMTPERVSRMALGLLRTNRKLAEVARENPHSFVHAVVQASQLGLEIGSFGEAHLVPFKDEIVLIPGYQGLVKLAKNTGQVIDIYAHEVRANDKFKMVYGLARDMQHEPLCAGGFPASDKEHGEIVGFYAVAVYKDGTRTFWAMGVVEVDEVRDASRGFKNARNKDEHPWLANYEAMGRKTVIRRLCNLLPKSPELAAALAIDAAGDAGKRASLDAEFVVVPDDDDNGERNDDDGQQRLSGPTGSDDDGGGAGVSGGNGSTAQQSTVAGAQPAGTEVAGDQARAAKDDAAPRFGQILSAIRAATSKDQADEALADSVGNKALMPAELELLQSEHADDVNKIVNKLQEKPAPQAHNARPTSRRGGVE